MPPVLTVETAILHELPRLTPRTLDTLATRIPAYTRLEIAEALVRMHHAGTLSRRRRSRLIYQENTTVTPALVASLVDLLRDAAMLTIDGRKVKGEK